MQWGVRRDHRSTGHGKSINKYTDDYLKSQALNKKGAKNLTNAELRELTQRLQLEILYKDLNKKRVSAGRKFVTDIIKEVGKEVVKETIKETVKAVIKGK